TRWPGAAVRCSRRSAGAPSSRTSSARCPGSPSPTSFFGRLPPVGPRVGLVAIGWALLTALTIGVYTTLDAAGARRTDSGFVYGIVLVVGAALAISVLGVVLGRGRQLVR